MKSRCYVSIGEHRKGFLSTSFAVDRLLYQSEHAKNPEVRKMASKVLREKYGIRDVAEDQHEVVYL